MALSIEIVSPTKVLFKGDASEIVVPSVNGETGILSMHADYMTLLDQGNIVVKNGSQSQTINITGGVAKVEKDKILILVQDTEGLQ